MLPDDLKGEVTDRPDVPDVTDSCSREETRDEAPDSADSPPAFCLLSCCSRRSAVAVNYIEEYVCMSVHVCVDECIDDRVLVSPK